MMKHFEFTQHYDKVVKMSDIKDVISPSDIKSIKVKAQMCHDNAFKITALSSKYGTPIHYCEGMAPLYVPHAFNCCDTPDGVVYFDATLGNVGEEYRLYREFTLEQIMDVFKYFQSSMLTIEYAHMNNVPHGIIDNNGDYNVIADFEDNNVPCWCMPQHILDIHMWNLNNMLTPITFDPQETEKAPVEVPNGINMDNILGD